MGQSKENSKNFRVTIFINNNIVHTFLTFHIHRSLNFDSFLNAELLGDRFD